MQPENTMPKESVLHNVSTGFLKYASIPFFTVYDPYMLLEPMLPITPCTTKELEFSKSLLQSMQFTMTSTVNTFSVGPQFTVIQHLLLY